MVWGYGVVVMFYDSGLRFQGKVSGCAILFLSAGLGVQGSGFRAQGWRCGILEGTAGSTPGYDSDLSLSLSVSLSLSIDVDIYI